MIDDEEHASRFPTGEELGLRDRKKVRVRATLVETAMRLFAERGYDAVTVEEIAAASDVSRRTFFRYFATKEAVLMSRREGLAAVLRAALASSDEPPFEAVRAALIALADEYVATRDVILAERALVRAVPALVVADIELDRLYEAIIAEHFLAATGRAAGDKRRAKIAAAAIVGTVRVVIDEWADGNGKLDLARVGAEALDLLEPLVRTR